MHDEHHHHHHHHEGSEQDHNDGSEVGSAPSTLFLLKYMLEHNEHHAEELHKLLHQLEEAGSLEAAEAVGRAFKLYTQGNEELSQAINHL